MNLPLRTQKTLGGCFYLSVPVVSCPQEQQHYLEMVSKHEKAVTLMLKGEITPDDLIDATVEYTGLSADQYIDEVETNLDEVEEEVILWLPFSCL